MRTVSGSFTDGQENLWEMTAPAGPVTTRLRGRHSADVVVVGAGYTGLSAALHLARGGASVIVLEADRIGAGASGRNVGLVNAGLWLRPSVIMKTLGAPYGERVITMLGDAPNLVSDLITEHGIRCDFERVGTLHCSANARGNSELRQRATEWARLGAPVRLLDESETRALTGTGVFSNSLLDLRAGTIQPLAYARGLAQAAIQAGCRIFTASEVRDCTQVGARWRVSTAEAEVSSGGVVLATGAYTSGGWSEIRAQQIHLPYFNFATEPLSDEVRRHILPEGHGAWDTNAVLTSFRLDRDGRLIIGSVGSVRGRRGRIQGDWAKRIIRHMFPQIGTVKLEAGWHGMIDMTDDHVPRLHRLGTRAVCVTGYNGRGIAPGTAFGRMLAQYLLGSIRDADLPLPLTRPRPARFRRSLEFLYDIGALGVHWLSTRC